MDGGPHWAYCLAAPNPTPRSWLVFGGCSTRAPIDQGVRLLRLGSWGSPQGRCGASLLAGVVASGHVPSADILRRRLMVSGLSCLVEELRHAPPCHPTLFGRWDVGPCGVDLVEEKPWHLVHVDPANDGGRWGRITSSPVSRRAQSGQRAWVSSSSLLHA